MRISIKKHHAQYLTNLAEQMGTDATTALDFAIWTLKQQGFSFTSALPPQPPQALGAFTPYQPLQPQDIPTLDSDTFEHLDQEPDDEVVRKFAQLLEEF